MGSSPVRVGNGAATQLQLDIYGELIDSIYLYNKHGEPISYQSWTELRRIVEWLCDNWDRPDEGIWETRGGQQDFTYSRLMSWVAIERAVRMARYRGLPADMVKWLDVRDRITEQIMSRGWNDQARRLRPALRLGRARRLAAADAADEVHRPEGPALAAHAGRDRPRARRGQPRLPLQRQGLARRPGGRGGHVLDLHLLVRRGARPRGLPGRGPARLREDAHATQTTSASTPRRSGPPASCSATSRRPSRTCP